MTLPWRKDLQGRPPACMVFSSLPAPRLYPSTPFSVISQLRVMSTLTTFTAPNPAILSLVEVAPDCSGPSMGYILSSLTPRHMPSGPSKAIYFLNVRSVIDSGSFLPGASSWQWLSGTHLSSSH